VVRTDRSIGGFAGQTEGAKIAKKIRLLKAEGIAFETSGTVAPQCLFTFKS
jgi:hypothetical protein